MMRSGGLARGPIRLCTAATAAHNYMYTTYNYCYITLVFYIRLQLFFIVNDKSFIINDKSLHKFKNELGEGAASANARTYVWGIDATGRLM